MYNEDTEGMDFGGDGYARGNAPPSRFVPTALDDGSGAVEASPGPGATDGLEPGTDNPPAATPKTTVTGGRTDPRSGSGSVGTMGRRGYSPASTMLQGSRKLG